MAVKYLRSAAAGAGTGADWTNAYTTLVAALAGVSAGDTIYVADDHAETGGATLTITSPGTAASPVRIICTNTHVTVPPTATGTAGTVTNTGNVNMNFAGYAYVYGVAFSIGSAGLGSAANFQSTSAWGWTFEACKLTIGSAGINNAVVVGASLAGGSASSAQLTLINTPLSFVGVNQTVLLRIGRLLWVNTASAIQGTVPTILLTTLAGNSFDAVLSGLDLSAAGTGKSLLAAGVAAIGRLFVRNCKLGASVTALSGTIPSRGAGELYLENCDSSNTNYRMEHYKYEGSIVHETTKVRTSGASDGTTPLSHKFVSLTTGPTLFSPLEGPWMNIWNDTSGSSKTLTVEFLHDSVTNLQNADIYLEVEYLGTSGFPESIYTNNRVADVFATAADCPAGVGTGSWTTTGLTNPNSQKLSVTFTPQVKGPIRARVCVIKSNYTVYVDPMLTIT